MSTIWECISPLNFNNAMVTIETTFTNLERLENLLKNCSLSMFVFSLILLIWESRKNIEENPKEAIIAKIQEEIKMCFLDFIYFYYLSNARIRSAPFSVCLNPFDGLDLQPYTSLILRRAPDPSDGPRFLGAIKLLCSFWISSHGRGCGRMFTLDKKISSQQSITGILTSIS